VVTRRGKALYDGKLRCNTHRQNDFIRFVDKIMVKNLLRSAGTAWTYWPRVFTAMLFSVRGHAYRTLNRMILTQKFFQKIGRKDLNLLDYKNRSKKNYGIKPRSFKARNTDYSY
jgi:hypothetical protein